MFFFNKSKMSNTKHIVLSDFINTKERFIRTEIKIVFLPALSTQGNKISHQNTLAWLILKSEEEDFLRKQVSPRPPDVRLFLICFCVVLW